MKLIKMFYTFVLSFVTFMTLSQYVNASEAFSIDDLGNSRFYGKVTIGQNSMGVSNPIEIDTININGKPVVHSSALIPVGGIIDWWRPTNDDSLFPLPYNFLVCDGKTVGDPDSPFYLHTLPNLIGLFTAGMEPKDIGKKLANTSNDVLISDFASDNSSIIDHGMPQHYHVQTEHGGPRRWDQGVLGSWDDQNPGNQGQHRHELPYFGVLKIIRYK